MEVEVLWDIFKWVIGILIAFVAGTFLFWWRAHKRLDQSNHDAHEKIHAKIEEVENMSAKRHSKVRDMLDELLKMMAGKR